MTTTAHWTTQMRGLLLVCAAYLAASASLGAQTAPVPAEPDTTTTEKKSETVQLSKFEVNTTQDTGYVANNTASALKTNEQLIRIPQAVTVVTRVPRSGSGTSGSGGSEITPTLEDVFIARTGHRFWEEE